MKSTESNAFDNAADKTDFLMVGCEKAYLSYLSCWNCQHLKHGCLRYNE